MSHYTEGELEIDCTLQDIQNALLLGHPEWAKLIHPNEDGLGVVHNYQGGDTYIHQGNKPIGTAHVVIDGKALSGAAGDIGITLEKGKVKWKVDTYDTKMTNIFNWFTNEFGTKITIVKAKRKAEEIGLKTTEIKVLKPNEFQFDGTIEDADSMFDLEAALLAEQEKLQTGLSQEVVTHKMKARH